VKAKDIAYRKEHFQLVARSHELKWLVEDEGGWQNPGG
jgi:hypothetical protein